MAGSEQAPAGATAGWLRSFRDSLERGLPSDVPCGTCTACCRSAQFVHIEPDEVDTLAAVPGELLFPAPGRPPGHRVMGYDEQGRCPMLGDDGCRIYEHRPRTCRVYDCRVYAATGVTPDQPLIAERVAQWRFESDEEADRRALAVLRSMVPAHGRPAERAIQAIRLSPASD